MGIKGIKILDGKRFKSVYRMIEVRLMLIHDFLTYYLVDNRIKDKKLVVNEFRP